VKLVPYQKAYGRNFEDIKKRFPNTIPLLQHLGWIPQKPLEKIIKEIAEWMESK
jgi:UDP-glucose 4-epimerase